MQNSNTIYPEHIGTIYVYIYIYQYPCEKPLKEKAPKRKTGLLQWKTVYIRSSYCYYYYYSCYYYYYNYNSYYCYYYYYY